MFNAPIAQQSDASKSQSELQIESLVRTMVTAINEHDFDPTSPAWACATYSFYAEIAFTSPSTSRLPLPAYLSLFKTLLTTHPGYIGQKFRIVDLSPVVDEKSETGNVFTNMEWYNPNEAGLQKRSDARGGLVKPAVGTWEFKRVGMQWVCVKFQVVPGITPTVGV